MDRKIITTAEEANDYIPKSFADFMNETRPFDLNEVHVTHATTANNGFKANVSRQ